MKGRNVIVSEAVLPVARERMASHSSDAFVISCIDPRFQTAIYQFIQAKHPGSFDSFLSIPGGAGMLAYATTNLINPRDPQTVDAVKISRATRALVATIDALEVASTLHNIQHLYLFCHTNCGDYRIPRRYCEMQQQKRDLLSVKDFLQEAMTPYLDAVTPHLYIADGHSMQHPDSIVMRKIVSPKP